MTASERQYDRIAGALFGVAVGDALGGPLEFMSAAEILRKHGFVSAMLGGGWLHLQPGEITDDTQMTLCVAEGIAEAPEAPVPAIGRRFLDWSKQGPKDVGGACASSIDYAWMLAGGGTPTAEQWEAAAEHTQTAQGHAVEGNGALMRTVYPGLYYADADRAERIARQVARMTHMGPRSTHACALYTRLIHQLTAEELQLPFSDYLAGTCEPEGYPVALTPDAVTPAAGGYVVDSLRIALGCAASADSFEGAVALAANLGGDADTNAAITGGLAGAKYGFGAIPEAWVRSLAPQVREDLTRLAKAALQARSGE